MSLQGLSDYFHGKPMFASQVRLEPQKGTLSHDLDKAWKKVKRQTIGQSASYAAPYISEIFPGAGKSSAAQSFSNNPFSQFCRSLDQKISPYSWHKQLGVGDSTVAKGFDLNRVKTQHLGKTFSYSLVGEAAHAGANPTSIKAIIPGLFNLLALGLTLFNVKSEWDTSWKVDSLRGLNPFAKTQNALFAAGKEVLKSGVTWFVGSFLFSLGSALLCTNPWLAFFGGIGLSAVGGILTYRTMDCIVPGAYAKEQKLADQMAPRSIG